MNTDFLFASSTATSAADMNRDGEVDIYDAIILSSAHNSGPADPSWNANADLNGDNIIDIYDAIALANNY